MFGLLTRNIKTKIVDTAVQELASKGTTSIEGIGLLGYNYEKNEIFVLPDPDLLERIREAYKLRHKED